MWVVYALLSALFAAIMTILIKLGLKDINLYLATAIRVSIVTLICWIIVLSNGTLKEIKNIDWKNAIILIASGLATGAAWIFYYYALKIGPASKVAAVEKLSVVLVALLAFIIIKEAISWKTALGIFLISSGTLVIIFS
ncbi:MAG: EamA family transporter [Bacilli bacterium]|jgi:transporter family protein|nr:EamA family transporter [Acholeplasmataceae bacterium]